MAQVVVTVNGRPYTMQCDDGQEDHLAELGRLLDDEVTSIKNSVGQVGDIRLLLMAGLVIADRLSDALKRIEDHQEQMEGLQQRMEGLQQQSHAAAAQDGGLEDKVSERLIAAAQRLEQLAKDHTPPQPAES